MRPGRRGGGFPSRAAGISLGVGRRMRDVPAGRDIMRTLHRYTTSSFLVSFLIAAVVLTFVMCVGLILKATDLLARGAAWRPIVYVAIYGMPASLAFSMPIAALVSSLLVFGRLSADGEITAMKACGIGMRQIVAGPLMASVCLAVVCVYVNTDLAPRSHFARRNLKASLGAVSPADLLEEGRWIRDFSGISLYVGKKKGALLSDVRVYDLREDGIKREIVARSGVIRAGENGEDVVIDLTDVRVDPFAADRSGAAFFGEWSVVVEGALAARRYSKREDDMTLPELTVRIGGMNAFYPDLDKEDLPKQKMCLAVELNKRLALSLSCFSFVLLGMPLGIKAHRKESSVGVGISLLLVFNFYLFIIVAESLEKHPAARPDLIVWLPVVLSVALGIALTRRMN